MKQKMMAQAKQSFIIYSSLDTATLSGNEETKIKVR